MNTFKKAAVIVAAAGGLVGAGMGAAHASTEAEGAAVSSPGVLSGNLVQVAPHIPVNICGNTVNIIGALNPAIGNTCANFG